MTQILPHDDAVAHRYPQVIVTDAFLNDPLSFFNNFKEFDLESKIREATAYSVVDRDQAEFAVVDLGATTSQNYVVAMFTSKFNRTSFAAVIPTEISELI